MKMNIKVSGILILSCFCFYGADENFCTSLLCDAEQMSQGIIERNSLKRPLLLEHEKFLFPEFSDEPYSFFIELNRLTPLVEDLVQSVLKSDLNAERKEAFRRRTLALSKDAAWEEIILNLYNLPPLLPRTDVRHPSAQELKKFSDSIVRIKMLEQDFLAEMNSALRDKDKIVSRKMLYFEEVANMLECFWDASVPEVRDAYNRFFDEIFVSWFFRIKKAESLMEEEIRSCVSESAASVVERIKQTDSPLKDYIYLRLYEKMREERQ